MDLLARDRPSQSDRHDRPSGTSSRPQPLARDAAEGCRIDGSLQVWASKRVWLKVRLGEG
jgi:hypothetical protein